MNQEIKKLYDILVEILGESKGGYEENNFQYQFSCPRCIDKKGQSEARKYNLECNILKQVYQCWSCLSEGDNMHGPLIKLIREYGNDKLVSEYKETILSIRESKLYKLQYNESDFKIDTSIIEREELRLPPSFKKFEKGKEYSSSALRYLSRRGIGWDIIEKYGIGYTEKETNDKFKKYSYRIIIPSYNSGGDLNYWVARDYFANSKRIKYANPKVEKTSIIFNEEKIQWDADITLVEGPFDHIVVPNSIPLLGKVLKRDYKLYWQILSSAKGNVNIFLDNDAYDSAKEIYKLLNHGNLYNRVRIILSEEGEDPSSLYEKGGYKEIAKHLANARQIEEVYL